MPEMAPDELDAVCTPPELKSLVKCVFCKYNLTDNVDDMTGAHLLVCFHSVCKKCVEEWDDSATKFCPECSVDVPKDLVDHKLLQELVEEPHSETARKGMCGMHPDTQATRWCVECSSLVCVECINNHVLLKGTSSHEIIDATDILPTVDQSLVEYTCKLHPSMQLEIFCVECEMMTCRNCQLENHKQHNNNYEFIADLCKEYKHGLIRAQQVLRESEETWEASQKTARMLQADLLSQKEKIRKDISAIFDRIAKNLKCRFTQLVNQLDTIINGDVKAIEDRIVASSKFSAPLKHCIQIVDLMLLHASDNTVMHSKKHLEKCFKLLQRRTYEGANPDVKKIISFRVGENVSHLEEMIKQVGTFHEEYTHTGNSGMYRQLIEEWKLTCGESEVKAPEKTVNPPARIHLRQDLQSPESHKSMERASIDSSASVSPEVGGMPNWHTPQEPRAPKQVSSAAVMRPPVAVPNMVAANVQMADLQVTPAPYVPVTGPSYTITSGSQQAAPNSQRNMTVLLSGVNQQPLHSGAIPMQVSPPPSYNYTVNQPPTTRSFSNPSNVAQRRQSEPPRNHNNNPFSYQNLLRSGNVSITSSSSTATMYTTQQVQQMQLQQQQQSAQMQSLQPQPVQVQQIQLQQTQQSVQLQSLQPQPIQVQSLQAQGVQIQALQHMSNMAYIPGSTHNPYPQI